MSLISPLGGALVNAFMGADEQRRALSDDRPSLTITPSAAADLRLLAAGAYSPLAGFMNRADYESVVGSACLADGTPWTLPVCLPVSADDRSGLREGTCAALRDASGTLLGTITIHELYERDPDREAREVYRTNDVGHPGVRALFEQSAVLVGGEVRAVPSGGAEFPSTPSQTRAAFEAKGWSTVVAFQTRNPVHRAHEYLTKVALENVDGLLLHPLSGQTKDDDVPFEVRLACYKVLLERYYPQDRVILGLFPATMRYAGPREAIYHGLVRRNFGCSHFIIGRDAAGVGSYYGPYDAQQLYDELGGEQRLGFTALKFEQSFYCRACEGMASTKTCPHDESARLILSGTRVREMLVKGEAIPEEFTRPEVAQVLRTAYQDR
jgi:sulfate adenylyltransferase